MRNIILFDVGGVIRIYDDKSFNAWLKNTFHPNGEIEPAWKKWRDLRDIDKIDEHEFYANFISDIGISAKDISEEDFYAKFFNEHIETNEKILKFIENQLFGKFRLYIFSNMSRMEVKEHRKKVDYEKFFDKCVYSFNLGLIKPDIEFFKKGLDVIEHKGDECIFFDNNLKNKKNSEKLGIKFVQYVDFDKFSKDIESLKYNPER